MKSRQEVGGVGFVLVSASRYQLGGTCDFFFIDCSTAKHVVPGSPYHRSMERLHGCKQCEVPATYKPQHHFAHCGAFLKRKPLNSGKPQLNMLQRAIFYLSHYNWWLVLLNCDCKHLPVEAPSEMLVSFHTLHCSRYSSAPFAADWFLEGLISINVLDLFRVLTQFIIFKFLHLQCKSLKTELSQNF